MSAIAYPIGYPIASSRVYPNRPRIARPVSARVGPFLVVAAVCGVTGQSQIQTHRYLDAARLDLEIER